MIPHAAGTGVAEADTRTSVLVRFDVFDALCKAKGLDLDIQRAAALGIHHTHLGRIRKGKARVGGKFIAATLDLLNVPFEVVFERRAV